MHSMMDRRRFLWLAAAGAGGWLARGVGAAPARICAVCGHEALHDGPLCLHCGAALPPLPETDAPAPKETPTPPAPPETDPMAANGVIAAEALANDLRWARQLAERGVPWGALFAARNTAAMAALRGEAGAKELAAASALALELRRAMFVVQRPCSVCEGTGRRRIYIVTLKGEVKTQELPSLACESCGGSGRWRARPLLDELSRDEAAAKRAYAVEQLRRGRVESSGIWLPRGVAEKLDVRATAALRKAFGVPCAACLGFGALGCSKCEGAGRIRCANRNCLHGVELCPDCGGTGRSRAAASGMTATIRRCETCGGAGKIQCRTCGGKGHLECDRCEGRGETLCAACRGAGEAPECNRCGGAGFIGCARCAGTGQNRGQPCPACGGQGVLLCTQCQGFGRVARRR